MLTCSLCSIQISPSYAKTLVSAHAKYSRGKRKNLRRRFFQQPNFLLDSHQVKFAAEQQKADQTEINRDARRAKSSSRATGSMPRRSRR